MKIVGKILCILFLISSVGGSTHAMHSNDTKESIKGSLGLLFFELNTIYPETPEDKRFVWFLNLNEAVSEIELRREKKKQHFHFIMFKIKKLFEKKMPRQFGLIFDYSSEKICDEDFSRKEDDFYQLFLSAFRESADEHNLVLILQKLQQKFGKSVFIKMLKTHKIMWILLSIYLEEKKSVDILQSS